MEQIALKHSAVPAAPTSSKTFKELGAKFKNLGLQTAVSFTNLARQLSDKVKPLGSDAAWRQVPHQHELYDSQPSTTNPTFSNGTPLERLSLPPAASFPNLSLPSNNHTSKNPASEKIHEKLDLIEFEEFAPNPEYFQDSSSDHSIAPSIVSSTTLHRKRFSRNYASSRSNDTNSSIEPTLEFETHFELNSKENKPFDECNDVDTISKILMVRKLQSELIKKAHAMTLLYGIIDSFYLTKEEKISARNDMIEFDRILHQVLIRNRLYFNDLTDNDINFPSNLDHSNNDFNHQSEPSTLVSMYQGTPMRPVFDPNIPPPPQADFSRPPPPFGIDIKLVGQEIISTYAKPS